MTRAIVSKEVASGAAAPVVPLWSGRNCRPNEMQWTTKRKKIEESDRTGLSSEFPIGNSNWNLTLLLLPNEFLFAYGKFGNTKMQRIRVICKNI